MARCHPNPLGGRRLFLFFNVSVKSVPMHPKGRSRQGAARGSSPLVSARRATTFPGSTAHGVGHDYQNLSCTFTPRREPHRSQASALRAQAGSPVGSLSWMLKPRSAPDAVRPSWGLRAKLCAGLHQSRVTKKIV